MHMNKLISLIVSTISILGNNSNAGNINEQIDKKVHIKFDKNGECTVKCNNDEEYYFTNFNSLSNNISNITNEYFTVNFISMNHYDGNVIVFQNFNYTYTNENNYQLFIEGSD